MRACIASPLIKYLYDIVQGSYQGIVVVIWRVVCDCDVVGRENELYSASSWKMINI